MMIKIKRPLWKHKGLFLFLIKNMLLYLYKDKKKGLIDNERTF